MHTRKKHPDVPTMMRRLSLSFIEKAKETYPQAPSGVGWMRALSRDLEGDPSRFVNQTMISKIVSFSRYEDGATKIRAKIGIDTIVKVRNYVGVSLDELLGLEPASAPSQGDLERRLAALEQALGHVESGTRKKK